MSSREEKVQAYRAKEQEILEKTFLKGSKDEHLGVYCSLFSAKTAVEGQDGGVVTSLLQKGFGEGLFDAAIVVRRMKGYTAEAVVVDNADAVLETRGTTYVKVNVSKKLRELIDEGKKRIAIVCTPCEVKAVRKIQQTIGKECEVTVIGLFCFEAFNPTKLKAETQKHLGVDLEKAGKTQIKQGKFLAQVKSKEVSCRVRDLHDASEVACRFCGDFSSSLADVSVGSAGSIRGYSTVIVRSPVGERLLKGHNFITEDADRQEIIKLAGLKSERAKKGFAALNAAK